MSTRGSRYWTSGSVPLVAPEILGDIIATASDLAIVVTDTGQVLSVLVNPTHRSFGNLDHWEGRDIRDFLTSESIPKLDGQLDAFSSGDLPIRSMELNHTDGGDWEFPVRYALHQIGPDGALLMLGRDLRPIAEMQQQLVNAQLALERDYEAQREYDTRLRVLLDTASEAMVFVSVERGRITDANGAAAALLGASVSDLAGAPFGQEFDGKRVDELVDMLTASAVSDLSKPIEVQTRRTRMRVMITPRAFRAAGERYLLCKIVASDEAEPVTDTLSENLNALYQEGAEAILFTSQDGTIAAANEAFLNMVDVAHVTLVRGRPLSDFLARGTVDTKVLIENAVRTGRMSLYGTRLVSEYGGELAVEISATHLNDRANPAFVFVMRGTGQAEAVRNSNLGVADDSVKSVIELVGSATLKEIVSDTTDVIEKMCIETAVRLTNNNRVAAAEMLGLSRQSLYVKLRKFGLLSRDTD